MGGGGSSGVHAMDGQSGDGAREGETLGKGGSHPESETLGKGGSDAHSDNSDDLCFVLVWSRSSGGSLPSFAPTEASGIEGDPNAVDTGGDERPMRYEPEHDVEGDWDDPTPVEGKSGAWGILCGNWGGQWHEEMLQKLSLIHI